MGIIMSLSLKKYFKIIVANSLVLAVLAVSSNIFAARGETCTDPVVATVQSMVDVILVDLNKQLKKDGKIDGIDVYQLINKQLIPKADLSKTAQLVLGGYWKNSLDDDQKKRFLTEFSRQMIRTYGKAFEAYDGETVDFTCQAKMLPKQSEQSVQRAEVISVINHNKQPATNVKFRLLDKNGEWVVYDLIIEGISIVDSYRTAYAAKFDSMKTEDILKEMHENNCKDGMLKSVC